MTQIDGSNHWKFKLVEKNHQEDEPMGEQFFVNSENLTQVSALVRESTQNSIDAREDKSRPVLMRFTVGAMTSELEKHYLNDLMPHINTALPKVLSAGEPNQEKFLIVEDFNTKGLKGATTSKRPDGLPDASEPDRDSFYFFEWKTGESNKGTGTKGKWGVGKVVFSYISKIKTYFVFTSRDEKSSPGNNPNLVFGHSVLHHHNFKESRCEPYHRWMTEDSNGNFIPFADEQMIDKFSKDWQVSRKTGERGTSIVVPYCSSAFSVSSITQCLAQDYFIAFLDGSLECEILDLSTGQLIVLNKLSLISNIQELPSELKTETAKTKEELISLCELYIAKTELGTTKISINQFLENPNSWQDFTLSEIELSNARASLENGNPIHLDIQIRIPKRNQPNTFEYDNFSVLLQIKEEFRVPTTFCREGILIPDASSRLTVPSGYSSLVYVGPGPLANFLGDAEDPSHKSWSSKQEKFMVNYQPLTFSRDAIAFVRYSVNKLLQQLQVKADERDTKSLSAFFPVSEEVGPQNEVNPRIYLYRRAMKNDRSKYELWWKIENFTPKYLTLKQANPKKLEVVLDLNQKNYSLAHIDSTERYEFELHASDGKINLKSNRVVISTSTPKNAFVDISPLAQGFRIHMLKSSRLPIGARLIVEVAYAQREGGGFRSWGPEDFSLSHMYEPTKTKGLSVACEDNLARLEVNSKDFSAEWSGFDEFRVLQIDVRLD